MGPNPKLYIFNKARYQSKFSLFVSLMVIFLSVIYILYSFIDYFKNDKPIVVYSKSNDKNEKRKKKNNFERYAINVSNNRL